MAVTVADAFLGCLCLWSQSLNLRKHSFFLGGGVFAQELKQQL